LHLFVNKSGLVTTSPCPPYICLQLQPSYGISTCHLHELNTTMRGATLTIHMLKILQPLYLCLGDCGWTRVHSPHLWWRKPTEVMVKTYLVALHCKKKVQIIFLLILIWRCSGNIFLVASLMTCIRFEETWFYMFLF